jgi:hypothetical protein
LVHNELGMIVDLKNLPAKVCFNIVDYCCDNLIEPEKCLNFRFECELCEDLEFDIPDEHVTYMILKGIFE